MATVSVELSDRTYYQLQRMAAGAGLPIAEFLDHLSQPATELNEFQLADIDRGLEDIAAGKFATHEQMRALFDRFEG